MNHDDQVKALLNKIGGKEGMLAILSGRAEIVYKEHIVNLDADPRSYFDWPIKEHRKGGRFVWDSKKVDLFLHEKQQNGKSIEGYTLHKKLAGKSVFNVNLLDYLLDNPHLIPDEWKTDEFGQTLYIFFWGTIYRGPVGFLYVRCLCFDGGHWEQKNYTLINDDFDSCSPALIFAS